MNLIAATYTPMHNDLSINLDMIKSYGDFLILNKIHGAFINGSTGDFVSLSTLERKKIAEKWAEQRKDGFKIINHVGHTSLLTAIELAQHSATLADGIAVIAPYYFKVKKIEKLVQYCKEVAAAAPNLPFYYYHIPVLSGTHFEMHKFIDLAIRQIPNFKGIKFTHNDFIDFQQCVLFNKRGGTTLEFYFGIDEMFLNSLPLGGYGWVGSTYNHIAPLYREIYKAFENQEFEKAVNLQDMAIKFVQILDKYDGFNGASKSFMNVMGINCGPSRFPHSTLNELEIESIKQEMKLQGLVPEHFSVMELIY